MALKTHTGLIPYDLTSRRVSARNRFTPLWKRPLSNHSRHGVMLALNASVANDPGCVKTLQTLVSQQQ